MRIIPLFFIFVVIILLLSSFLYVPIGKFVSRIWNDAADAMKWEDDKNTNADQRKDEVN